jgi:hypothetical protein
MPRRNRNARYRDDTESLAATITRPETTYSVSDAKYPCAGCRRRGHWDGEYCPLCKGHIILATRQHVLTGR